MCKRDTVMLSVCFQPVNSEVLKAENVEQADGSPHCFELQGRRLINGCIDFLNNPHKQASVYALWSTQLVRRMAWIRCVDESGRWLYLNESVSHVQRLFNTQRSGNRLSTGYYGSAGQAVHQVLQVHLKTGPIRSY